jgi:hypothetical protein
MCDSANCDGQVQTSCDGQVQICCKLVTDGCYQWSVCLTDCQVPDVTQSSVSIVQVALTQEQASKVLGQLEAALVDLSSLPGMKRSAWFERNRVTAILEAICEDRDHSHIHMVTRVLSAHCETLMATRFRYTC